MNTSFNTKHYTYHIGTSSELNSCSKILYYYSDNLGDDGNLSIISLKEKYNNILNSYTEGVDYFISSKDEDKDYFILKGNNDKVIFDTIIYIGISNVLGYTVFSEPQTNYRGNSRIGEMRLSFEFSIKMEYVDFNITFTLDPIWETLEPLLKNYPKSLEDVKKIYNDSGYLRYTDDLIQLESDDDFCDITDSGALTRENSYKFWIPKEIPLTKIEDFQKYSFSYHEGNLLLSRWNDLGYYTVDCVNKCNHFGIMKNIKTGRIFYDPAEMTINTIINGLVLFDINTDDGIKTRAGYCTLSDPNNKYINKDKVIITDPINYYSTINIINDNKTAFDLGLIALSKDPGLYYYLCEKYGGWYKFKNKNTGTICWASVFGSGYFYEEDLVFPLNKRVLIRYNDDCIDIYKFSGGTEFNLNSDPSLSTSYYYPESKVLFDGLRRNPLEKFDLSFLKKDPLIFMGILFYVSNNNIMYL